MEEDFETIQAAIAAGDAQAAERLLPLVYDELRKIAHQHVRRERVGHSLYTTELVHEAYLRLLRPGLSDDVAWDGQAHYLAAAARAMRNILVDRARARGAAKRGGDRRRLDLSDLGELTADDVPDEILDLEAALARLSEESPQKAELVSLRFYAGLTMEEAAAVLGVSSTTADRHWAFARAWLLASMDGEV